MCTAETISQGSTKPVGYRSSSGCCCHNLAELCRGTHTLHNASHCTEHTWVMSAYKDSRLSCSTWLDRLAKAAERHPQHHSTRRTWVVRAMSMLTASPCSSMASSPFRAAISISGEKVCP